MMPFDLLIAMKFSEHIFYLKINENKSKIQLALCKGICRKTTCKFVLRKLGGKNSNYTPLINAESRVQKMLSAEDKKKKVSSSSIRDAL